METLFPHLHITGCDEWGQMTSSLQVKTVSNVRTEEETECYLQAIKEKIKQQYLTAIKHE